MSAAATCRQSRSSYIAGCRCEVCREAQRVYQADLYRRRRADRVQIGGRWIANVAEWRHGHDGTYVNDGCRCVRCTTAHRVAAGGRP